MQTENEIINIVVNGNKSAFSELVVKHQGVLLRVAFRYMKDMELAEDVVQESFIKAYRKLGSFEGRSSFRSWMYQITVNTAKNKLRKKKFDTVDIDKVPVAVEQTLDANLYAADVNSLLMDEVNELPPKQKQALLLRIFDDMSFKEVAAVMECPYDTAKANYRHAIQKLKRQMGKKQKGVLLKMTAGHC